MDKEEMLGKLDKLHTTPMCEARIRLNMKPTKDVVAWALDIIKDPRTRVTRKGKNYYVQLNNVMLTVTSGSMTIITAHYIK